MAELGDKPIEDEHYEMMNAVARGLDEAFNGDAKGADREVGFILLVFPFGDRSGHCNYISNGADRKDVVVLFKEQIARFEGQPELKGDSMTHTYTLCEVSKATFDEIAAKFHEAGYDHAFMEDGALDMHGVAIIAQDSAPAPSTSTASGPGAPTIEWSDKELTALRECMEFQQLSERAVLRQALANYQIICRREHGLETEVPGPLKAESPYGEWCRDPKACAGKGYCPRDPTCGD